ncbi:MAG: dihydrolipoyl dehydrogenase [Candidatus Sumerlaeaceae bacterium]|nr:dihydrolipoyl dehydrogenase [Candidatus Sumerlaeaceae bacterium]
MESFNILRKDFPPRLYTNGEPQHDKKDFMADSTFDVIVIGAGPGGYVAAIRAAQLGFNTAIIEKNKTLGGTCLNVGCIPSKALLDSSELYSIASHQFKNHGIKVDSVGIDVPTMIARKNKVVDELTRGVAGLMKKNKITVVEGLGKLAGGMKVSVENGGKATNLEATKNILLAMGSVSTQLPTAKFDGKQIVSSTEALDFTEVPKKLVVVGGGYIGLELGSVWARLGAEVVVVEMLPQICPFMDGETRTALFRSLQRQGLEFRLETKVSGVDTSKGRPVVKVVGPGGKEETIECDKVLVSIGRRPLTENANLEGAGVELDERRRVKVDDHYQTTAPGISAIGDLIHGPMLAHKAEEEGIAWAENLAGQGGHVNYDVIPSVVYTWPEAASVGLTEEEAREKHGDEVKIGKFQFMANGRAKAMGEREGFVKVIAGPRDIVLGVHIFGPRASDMIAEAATVMEFNGTSEDIFRTCHGHPTLSEALKEAALGVHGRVISA